MDWNWFFSSIAQSVAALVGIFAAFVITKIVNNQAEFARKTGRLRELLSVSTRYRDALADRYFYWYSKQELRNELDSLDRVLEKEEEARTPEEYYEELNFPPFIPRSEVLQKIEERISTRGVGKRSYSRDNMSYVADTFRLETMAKLRPQLDHEKELIDALIVDVKQHIRLVKLQLGEVEGNPEASSLVSMSIAGAITLFFVGVIYPLSFLPVNNDLPISLSITAFFRILFSLKGLILAAASTIFTGIMVVFWRVNSSLKYRKEEVEKLREFTKMGNYSNYVAIMVNNLQEQRKWKENSKASSGDTAA